MYCAQIDELNLRKANLLIWCECIVVPVVAKLEICDGDTILLSLEEPWKLMFQTMVAMLNPNFSCIFLLFL